MGLCYPVSCFIKKTTKEREKMDLQTKDLWEHINHAIIKFRGVYAAWSKKHEISYNEMLVFYTIRDNNFCTQKQICDNYLLPRQTMNHVFAKLCSEGIIEVSSEYSIGREKAFVLTCKGETYAKPLIDSLNRIEEKAIRLMGKERIQAMTELVQDFDYALSIALEEND